MIFVLAIIYLPKWIKKYNGHNTFKTHGTKGANVMTSGRKLLMKKECKLLPSVLLTLMNIKFHINRFRFILG
ncbi:hypothetical protein [Clostridium botulinum]|uniref:hypothetical protein n=1 Tax=Clostridium botulinum TaxID=1491 RepID=UPI000773F60C|nr:hypothetical protein [Clostridium botulinum]MBN3397836.1 hypothetical protein [Clostridium botulinum]MBN3411759.1 hypothetical protein [Clostridium botulinum]